jgi:KipI family sensor histidine kinase inhibitor
VIRQAGDSGLLLELEPAIDAGVNSRAIAIAAAVRAAAMHGVRDVVSTFRSVAVYFDPLVADTADVRALLGRAADAQGRIQNGRHVEIPVTYGGDFGPDLGDVAAFGGLTAEQVIERHSTVDYRVYMLGFLPGFAYMGTVAPEVAAPRRAAPRARVPRGSVGIAGPQTAVYPRDSPGGWQIIGRTALEMFDPSRTPAALLAPGDSVRFVPAPASSVMAAVKRAESAPVAPQLDTTSARRLTVLRPGLFTTVQDGGRWGHQGSGVPVSGAMDLVSHRLANALVGNAADAATIEATLLGPELRIEQETTVAVTGADLSAAIDGTPVPLNTAIRSRGGAVLRFGDRRQGARAYVAFDGGIAIPAVLGSRATHAVSAMGGVDGRPLKAGDRLPLGPSTLDPSVSEGDSATGHPGGGARVRVLPGPQNDQFPEAAFDALQRARFFVSTRSDRMGYRLEGERILGSVGRDMISDATFAGAIQVPASGEPILLMADRQTTGGYPQIAVVITADLPRAAQLAPGDWIEFTICSHAEALAALRTQQSGGHALG